MHFLTRAFSVLIVSFLCATQCAAQRQALNTRNVHTLVRGSTQNDAEQAVRELERMYRDAVMQQDVAALNRILADDFVATSSRGEMRDKAKEIDDIKPSPDFKMEAFTLDEINVRFFGDTAIVTGRSRLQVAFKGQSNTSLFRYTRVYVRRSRRWQAVAQQLTRMPQQ